LQPWLHAVYVARVADSEWVLLAYRLPREPSTPRITLWRKLRRLGALQLVDGLVALPADPKTTEAFEWLAEEVVESGGEAWTWQAQAGSKAQEQALRAQLATALADEYRSLLEEAKAARSEPTRRTAQRLRRELHKIEARDHVSPKEREQARRAIERLLASVDAAEPKATSR
jgi:Protein ChrB, N-terminal